MRMQLPCFLVFSSKFVQQSSIITHVMYNFHFRMALSILSNWLCATLHGCTYLHKYQFHPEYNMYINIEPWSIRR